MRILKIAGQNIASLAEAFTIDLTAEPLRSAGLFAITGPTGAGKSSLLDALCLALYGDAPRLSSGSRQDEIPDAGGEQIKAQDPRAILRRGANQAWAAVTFTGIDGQDYEARWTVRRARDRAEGRLQGVSRQIARISDGQVLASQLTHVNDQVQALTGLSYDEFRRTVLLAQGDFDAFLRAETNERAALLEKVTGTGLYRAISTSVYDRTAEAQAAVTALTGQRDAHHLLTPDALAALQTERADLEAAITLARAQRQTIEADLTRHNRLTEAHTRLDEARLAVAHAHTQAATALPDRDRLARIDSAEPLRLPFEALRHADAAQTRATEALAQAAATLRAVREQRDNLLTDSDIATARHDATEAEFKTLGPRWTEATQLDSRLKDATDEATRAAQDAAHSQNNARDAHARLTTLQGQAETATAALTLLAQQLSSQQPVAALSDGWDSLSRDLTDREAAQLAMQQAISQQSDLAAQTETLQTRLQTLDTTDTADRTARDTQAAAAAALSLTIATLTATEPQERANSLTRLAADLADLDRAARQHAAATAAIATAAQQDSMANAAATQAQTAIATAQTALTGAEATAAALTAPAEQAHLAVSDAARTLRLHLVAGAPCPVCGATDHPNHTDTALAALAARLQQDLSRAYADAAAARSSLTAARGDLAAAMARAGQAADTLANQTNIAQQARTAWQSGLITARARPFCPTLPDDPPPDLTTALRQVDSARQATLAELAALADLRASKDRCDALLQRLTAAIDARATTRRDLTRTFADLAQQTALLQQQAATAGQRLTDLDAVLLPLLIAAGEPVLHDTAALRQRLWARVHAWRDLRDRHLALQTTLSDLKPHLAKAEASHADALLQANRAAEAEQSRVQTRTDLQAQRATLLGGEPTEAHRTRHNLARLAVQAAKDAAVAALSGAEAALGQAQGSHDSAAHALGQAEAAAERAASALSQALATTDLTPETLAPLLAVARTEVDALRHGLRQRDDAVTAALSAEAARQSDLAAALAAGIPDREAADLKQALADLDASQSARAERIGAVQTDLANDQTNRARLAGLEAEIATAEATLQVWAAVNTAIGSRGGDAFARIAQSITLDQLVDHANHHLADLKPRYRLQRALAGGAGGLALQVLDLDMGAEARATRSLSGGERFLVSLALALALSRMGDRGGLAATLFIDEGFGSLDAETLDVAIDALETLQAQGRTIGVISHVEAMKDRIPVQIRVERQGGGRSVVRIAGPVR